MGEQNPEYQRISRGARFGLITTTKAQKGHSPKENICTHVIPSYTPASIKRVRFSKPVRLAILASFCGVRGVLTLADSAC